MKEETLQGKMVKLWTKWHGHMSYMDDDRITVMASKINNYWGDQELGRDMK